MGKRAESVRLAHSFVRGSSEALSRWDSHEYRVDAGASHRALSESSSSSEERGKEDTIDMVIMGSLSSRKRIAADDVEHVERAKEKAGMGEAVEEPDEEASEMIRSLPSDDISNGLMINQSLLDDVPEEEESENERIRVWVQRMSCCAKE